MTITQRFAAEFIGTFWLVLAGCGTAVALSAAESPIAPGFAWLGVSLAFGLAYATMRYAVGHISGGHFNPAVTLGVVVGGRHRGSDVVPYWIAQSLGAVVATLLLYYLATEQSGVAINVISFVPNGFGEHSPGGFSASAAMVTEVILSFMFVLIILGVTDGRAPVGFAGVVIGLALCVIHLVALPITNGSVNPARSVASALATNAAGTFWPLQQVWLFIVSPLIGAVLAGGFYKWMGDD